MSQGKNVNAKATGNAKNAKTQPANNQATAQGTENQGTEQGTEQPDGEIPPVVAAPVVASSKKTPPLKGQTRSRVGGGASYKQHLVVAATVNYDKWAIRGAKEIANGAYAETTTEGQGYHDMDMTLISGDPIATHAKKLETTSDITGSSHEGYVMCTAANVDKVRENIRNFFAAPVNALVAIEFKGLDEAPYQLSFRSKEETAKVKAAYAASKAAPAVENAPAEVTA